MGVPLSGIVEEFSTTTDTDFASGGICHHRGVPLCRPLRRLCLSTRECSVVCASGPRAHLLRCIFTWLALEIPREILELCIGRVTRTLGVVGALPFASILFFLKWGPSRPTYLGAIVVVSWLEIVGTSIGTWQWMEYDTIKEWVAQGNPPSGAAGGYGWFDLFALLLAPVALRQVQKLRTRDRLRSEF